MTIASQDSRETINKVYELLDLHPGVNLITRDNLPVEKYQKIIFETAQNKLGVESIFFYQPRNDSVGVPYIFFYRLESLNKPQLAKRLAELHKLAWNMGRAPLLFAALPNGQVLIFNAYEPPTEAQIDEDYQTGLIEALNVYAESELFRQYHRQEFESGRFWQTHRKRFDPKKRADQTLLQNLKLMRNQLLADIVNKVTLSIGLEIVHSLLGRSIFLKYLEDRRDVSGLNVFPDRFFAQFFRNAECFTDVLDDKNATYELFAYLNEKFNGDLFPISEIEKQSITPGNLLSLKLFLIGEADLSNRQLSFWKFYSFDVIPIEFISSIYEEFFHTTEQKRSASKSINTATHYTPHHLVEFLADEVMPWTGVKTNFKTLDPACGSGIFLVEIYRRLIAHWEQANHPQKINFEQLRTLLIENIFGVDLDSNAIRVAAFSLYLTMCDFLEPRQIWEQVRFPELKQKNLFAADFFDNSHNFVDNQYDLIIGNPPWKSKLSDFAVNYVDEQKKTFPTREFAPDKQIALAFLWRAVEFCTSSGEVCLLLPSKGLLFNRSSKHSNFRRDFFTTYHVKTVINFSACRHILFEKGDGPGAAVLYAMREPDYEVPILYCSPKPAHSIEDKWQFTISPQDIAELPRDEAIQNNLLWKVAMWGGPRDWELIKKLTSTPYKTLKTICNERDPKWIHGEGVILGNEKKRKYNASWLQGLPYLNIPNSDLDRFVINEKNLPQFDIPLLYRAKNESQRAIFNGPHILIKQSPKVNEIGLRSALLLNDTVFRHSFIGIHGAQKDTDLLARCCLALNSRIPFYFALMTSGRWLVERDELDQEEILRLPLPAHLLDLPTTYADLLALSSQEKWEERLSSLVDTLYNLSEDELIIITDAINFTLDYFRRRSASPAVARTSSILLEQYVQVAQRTLKNSFDKPFKSIIFRDSDIPLLVIGFEPMLQSTIESSDLIYEKSRTEFNNVLKKIDALLIEQRSPTIFVQRNMRCYIGNTIYVIKPDQQRYWNRSSALRDADEIYADIMAAQE